MKVAIVRLEVPCFAFIEIGFSKGNELFFVPTLGGIGAYIYTLLGHAAEKYVSVGIGCSLVPGIYKAVNISIVRLCV